MNSYYTKENLIMIVKCWNCHNEFETSAAETSSLSAPIIEKLLLDNMFDGHSGGTIAMSVNYLVKEVAQIIAEELHEKSRSVL